MYIMHSFFAFVSRMWDIGIILLVAQLTGNSLFIVALAGLLSSSSVFLFSSSIGVWFDKSDRLYAMKIALLVKVVSVSVGYALCAQMLSYSKDGINTVSNYQIYSIPIVCALANLSFAMVTMSIEKDWVVVLSGGDTDWLSSTNSVMTQIDLACNAVAPVLTGLIFSFFSYRIVAIVLLALNAVTVFGLYIFLDRLYSSWPGLAVKPGTSEATTVPVPAPAPIHISSADDVSSVTSSPPSASPIADKSTLLGSGCAGAMVAYSCLYLTVLSFSSLMVVYLKWWGVEDHWIGLARGIAALSGFSGAWLYPYARRTFGLIPSAMFSIWWQCALVATAAWGILYLDSLKGVTLMVVAVLMSRVGLWLFDLCARQIAQETIVESHRGIVNGKWRSLTAFFDLSSYLIAVAFPNPEDFWILTSVSSFMVFVSALIFTMCNGGCDRCFKGQYSPLSQDMDHEMAPVGSQSPAICKDGSVVMRTYTTSKDNKRTSYGSTSP